eukprot:jgi/Phyca11/14899/fgenesh1_pg.PHYCAscaffold_10_\
MKANQHGSYLKRFTRVLYVKESLRCVIDDGSAQAELFLENDVAWELLVCTEGQRRRFEDVVSNYVEELTYFSGRTANGCFATSKAEREQEYYQNELRAFVLNTLPVLRRIVVFAHRFYSVKDNDEGTSVLTFGKDIHLTTKTLPQPKLEAKRVDQLHVRNELQQRLAQYMYQVKCTQIGKAKMASPPAIDAVKKSSSTRARKTTPRSRANKNVVTEKKAATPRRRASPRNVRKQEEKIKEEKNQLEKKTEPSVAESEDVSAASGKEKTQKSQQEADVFTEKTEPVRQETAAKEEELPLAQDTQLRRTYLQRVYRQLQSTHMNEDDTTLRQLATNVEMEACQKAATKSQYVTAMDQEIHKLMQFEMEQANAPAYTANAQRSGRGL